MDNSDKFMNLIDSTEIGKYNNESGEILSNKNVIWILGDYEESSSWRLMLEKIGVDKNKISIVNLI